MKPISELRCWVVVKKLALRKTYENDSPVLLWLPFGTLLYMTNDDRVRNGRINVTYAYIITEADATGRHQRRITVNGWVKEAGLNYQQVTDMARLYFQNVSYKPLKTYKRCRGEELGSVPVGEVVQMIAKSGDWYLSEKGWTKKAGWKKYLYLDDERPMQNLMLGVLLWAVKDYRRGINKLKKHQYKTRQEFADIMWGLAEIRAWMCSEEYALCNDTMTGEERLEILNNELGADKKWRAEQKRIMLSITRGKKGKVKEP